MNALLEMNNMVKLAQTDAYPQYAKHDDGTKARYYDAFKRKYGDWRGVVPQDAIARFARSYMQIHEAALERANQEKQRMAQRESEAKAEKDRAEAIKSRSVARPYRMPNITWDSFNEKPNANTATATSGRARPAGVTGLGKSIDDEFARLAKATGNNLLGSDGRVEFSSGGLFGKKR